MKLQNPSNGTGARGQRLPRRGRIVRQISRWQSAAVWECNLDPVALPDHDAFRTAIIPRFDRVTGLPQGNHPRCGVFESLLRCDDESRSIFYKGRPDVPPDRSRCAGRASRAVQDEHGLAIGNRHKTMRRAVTVGANHHPRAITSQNSSKRPV